MNVLCVIFFVISLLRFFDAMSPALEKTRLHGTDEARALRSSEESQVRWHMHFLINTVRRVRVSSKQGLRDRSRDFLEAIRAPTRGFGLRARRMRDTSVLQDPLLGLSIYSIYTKYTKVH